MSVLGTIVLGRWVLGTAGGGGVVGTTYPTMFASMPENRGHLCLPSNKGHLVMPENKGHLTIPDQR